MSFHFTAAELDAYRNGDCGFCKRGCCRLHLFFCKKCQRKLESLNNCDELLAAVRKTINKNEA